MRQRKAGGAMTMWEFIKSIVHCLTIITRDDIQWILGINLYRWLLQLCCKISTISEGKWERRKWSSIIGWQICLVMQKNRDIVDITNNDTTCVWHRTSPKWLACLVKPSQFHTGLQVSMYYHHHFQWNAHALWALFPVIPSFWELLEQNVQKVFSVQGVQSSILDCPQNY